MTTYQPFYRIKGKYASGKSRVIIEQMIDRWHTKSKALPKPEIMLEILDKLKWTKKGKGKNARIILELSVPKVNGNGDKRGKEVEPPFKMPKMYFFF